MKKIFASIILCLLALSISAQVKKPLPPPEPIVIRKESGTFKHIKGEPGRIPKIFETNIETDLYDWGTLEFHFSLGQGTCRANFGFSKKYEERGIYDRGPIAPGSSFKLERTLYLAELKKENKFYVYVSEQYLPLMDESCENTYEFTVYLTNYQRYVPPAPYPGTLGSADYYDFRHKDFIRRNPRSPVPDYYKDFGEKYFNRFVTETSPTLSEEGQKFLRVVGRALQQKIEDRLKADPRKFAGLERAVDQFRTFAYFTHPNAYCESGWENLPESDRAKIITAIDWKDKYMSWRGALAGGKIAYKCGSFLDLIP
jgi:hypothetical protein